MTAVAVLKRKGNGPMTPAAEFSCEYLLHCNAIAPLLRLEYLWMAVVAVKPLCMLIMRINHIGHCLCIKDNIKIKRRGLWRRLWVNSIARLDYTAVYCSDPVNKAILCSGQIRKGLRLIFHCFKNQFFFVQLASINGIVRRRKDVIINFKT